MTTAWLVVANPVLGQDDAAPITYSLANPVPRDALREFTSDRPSETEGPYTVDAGHLQIEMDAARYTRDRDQDLLVETLRAAPLNLRLGLADSTEVQLLAEPYVHELMRNRANGERDVARGFGEVTLRLKHNLLGNDGEGAAVALLPFVTLPTSDDGVGTRLVEFGLIVPLAVPLSDQVSLGAMSKIDFAEKDDGEGRAARLIHSAVATFELSDRLGTYAEIYTERSTERGADWIVTGDLGLTYEVAEDLQLDGGVNLGITHAADDVEVFVGLSRRF